MKVVRLSAVLIIVSMNMVRGEVYTEYTRGSFSSEGSTITTTPSRLGMVFNIAGVTTASIPLTELRTGSYLIVDTNIDASGNGLIYFVGGRLTLVDFVYPIPIASIGTVIVTAQDLTFNLTSGPLEVEANNFIIDHNDSGMMEFYGGTLSFRGSILGQDFDTTTFFETHPIRQTFNQLTAPLYGYTDSNSIGSDTDTNPHTGGNLSGGYPDAGLTGLSNIDTDGAETFINYNGLSIQTTVHVGDYFSGIDLPLTITITGNATVSVPELGSVALAGSTLSGLCLCWIRRSKE